MIFTFFLEMALSAAVLSVTFMIYTKREYRPEFIDVFYLAVGISFTNIMLIMILLPKIGLFVVIPCFAAGVYILMRFGGLAVLHASAILITYLLIKFLLPI